MLKPIAITRAGEQLRLGYDATHYTAFNTDSAGRLNITPNGGLVIINSDFGLAPAQTLYLDTGAGHFIRGNGADTVDIGVRGSVQFRFSYPVGAGPSVLIPFGNLSMQSGMKLFLDGGVNSYIFSPGAHLIGIIVDNAAICYFRGDTGSLQFGTFTGSGDVAVVGSILIQDAAGNSRKLAVVA